jgi:hypothetical protein
MPNKYKLTKELLETEYAALGNFQEIARKYSIARSTVERYYKALSIQTKPKTKYDVDESFFSKDTEESFYLAGFIAADGCITTHKSKEPNVLIICLSKKDEDHLVKLKNILGFTGPVKETLSKLSKYNPEWNDTKQVKISIYNKKIIDDLKRFGIGPRKSLTYDFPEWLIDHPLVHHFMRGYFDGDGSFSISKEHRKTKNHGIKTYEKYVFSLRGTLSFLSTFDKIIKRHIVSHTTPKLYTKIGELKYSGNINVKLISKFLYDDCDISLQRKFDIVKEIK